MKKKHLYFIMPLAAVLICTLSWLLAKEVGGWSNLGLIMSVFATGAVLQGGLLCAAIFAIYWLTTHWSQHYADLLRDAGYTVNLDNEHVRTFALLVVVASVITPFAIYATSNLINTYNCIQVGKCISFDGWHYGPVIMLTFLWTVSLTTASFTTYTWWQSFRPLKKYYRDMQLGYEINLPRLS